MLETFVDDARSVLADELLALYLYGTGATGGWDKSLSDLDLMAVTGSEIAGLGLVPFELIHRHFFERFPSWRNRVDVVYVGRATLASFREGGVLAELVRDMPLRLRDDAAGWIRTWYLVRRSGLTLYGPPPASLIPPIAEEEFKSALVAYVGDIRRRFPGVADPSLRAYMVLTTARALCALRGGDCPTKDRAAEWLRRSLPSWSALMDAAMTCRLSGGKTGFNDDPTLRLAFEFISFVADEVGAP
jgi:predicted nucleotidyltransferase